MLILKPIRRLNRSESLSLKQQWLQKDYRPQTTIERQFENRNDSFYPYLLKLILSKIIDDEKRRAWGANRNITNDCNTDDSKDAKLILAAREARGRAQNQRAAKSY